jgi:hypothetical protein
LTRCTCSTAYHTAAPILGHLRGVESAASEFICCAVWQPRLQFIDERVLWPSFGASGEAALSFVRDPFADVTLGGCVMVSGVVDVAGEYLGQVLLEQRVDR